jgi:hypothetical protein
MSAGPKKRYVFDIGFFPFPMFPILGIVTTLMRIIQQASPFFDSWEDTTGKCYFRNILKNRISGKRMSGNRGMWISE